jgi:ribonuclease HI
MEKHIKLLVFCDGGARGNPGPAASAFVIYQDKKEIVRENKFLGKATNNEAEYSAVLIAMEWLSQNVSSDINEIIFNLDSQLVVRQLSGIYKIKENRLKIFVTKIKSLERKINKKIIYLHVPRLKNQTADELVNRAIDENI